MHVVFDQAKDLTNRKKHKISLSRAEDFDFNAATYGIDDRVDYGETRYIAVSFLDARLYVLIFTQVEEDLIRAISLRKADRWEEEDYERD